MEPHPRAGIWGGTRPGPPKLFCQPAKCNHIDITLEITTGRRGRGRPGGTTKEQQEDKGKITTQVEVGAAGAKEREE